MKQTHNSLIAQLRSATAQEHDKTENSPLMLRIMGVQFSIDDYSTLLTRFLAYYAPAEDALTNCIRTYNMPYFYTPKTPFLQHDLKHLSAPIAPLPSKMRLLPFMHTPATFLGALYVLEGSTLGGSLIHKHLQQYISVDKLATFFYPYKKETKKHWELTRHFIDEYATEHSLDASEACHAAIQTFRSIRAMLDD